MKATCPGCNAHTSDVAGAFAAEEPCPNCGLSAASANEVLDARLRGANAEIQKRYEEAEVRAGRLQTEVEALRWQILQIRDVLDGNDG